MIVSTEAIVLKSKKYSDTSKIITMYSKDDGKISVIAKGSRSKNNKFGATLEPMSYIWITYYKKPNVDLYTLSSAEYRTRFPEIVNSLDKITTGLAMMEAINQTQEQHHENIGLFNEIINILNNLNEKSCNPFIIFINFLISITDYNGISFDINELADYNSNNKILFSIDNGRIIDNKFSNLSISNKNIYYLDKSIIDFIQKANTKDTFDNTKLLFDDILKMKVINFFISYFNYHLDKRISFKSFFLE